MGSSSNEKQEEVLKTKNKSKKNKRKPKNKKKKNEDKRENVLEYYNQEIEKM